MLNIRLPCDLSIYPRERETTCARIFIAATNIIVPNWKHPACPSVERISKLWHIYTVSTAQKYKGKKLDNVNAAEKHYAEWKKLDLPTPQTCMCNSTYIKF